MVSFSMSVSKSVLAKELGPVFDREYYFNPLRRYEIDSQCHELVARDLSDLGACFTESNLGRAPFITPKQVLIGGIQPNMILGMLLGAEFVPGMDKDADIAPECCRDMESSEFPEPESLLLRSPIQTFDEQFLAVKQEGRLEPIPPFFWDASGRAAVHGAMTTAQKLVGDRIFVDFLTEPDRSTALLRWITDATIVLVEHYATLAETPLTGIHIGECSACMVNPTLLEKFVLPEAARLGARLGPVRFHSCGRSDHFIASCARIANLETVDVGGDNSVAKIRETFGPDFPMSIAPPVKALSNPESAPLMEWANRVLDENQDGPLVIVCHLEPDYNLSAIRMLAERLRG